MAGGKAIVFWGKESKSSQLDDLWIARNVNQLAQAEAEQVAQLIQRAAAETAAALDEAGRVLSTGECEDRLNLHSVVKEMPVAEFAYEARQLARPLAFSFRRMGPALRRTRTQKAFRHDADRVL